MKSHIFSIAAVALTVAITSFTLPKDIKSLKVGAKAPKTDMKMKAAAGGEFSLADLKEDNGLLVIFSCNTCPFVVGSSKGTEGWEGRYAGIKSEAKANGIGMVLVNSNEAKRDKGDSLDDMKKRAEEQGFADIQYVLDTNSDLANAFGAKTTPHVFLFDKNMKLVYKGAIDDNVDSADKVTEKWLSTALGQCAAGEKVDPNSTRPVGCSIKRTS